jgi:hypothetical protein
MAFPRTTPASVITSLLRDSMLLRNCARVGWHSFRSFHDIRHFLNWHSGVCSCHSISTTELRRWVEEDCIEANSRDWFVRGDGKAIGEEWLLTMTNRRYWHSKLIFSRNLAWYWGLTRLSNKHLRVVVLDFDTKFLCKSSLVDWEWKGHSEERLLLCMSEPQFGQGLGTKFGLVEFGVRLIVLLCLCAFASLRFSDKVRMNLRRYQNRRNSLKKNENPLATYYEIGFRWGLGMPIFCKSL